MAGQLALADGELVFPRAPAVAGVYRLTLSDPGGARIGVYLGEADPLPRRFQHYRTPGAAEKTTMFRMNQILVGTLASGGRVKVEIATDAQVTDAGGAGNPLNLSWKAARVLIESAAEVAERTAGGPVLNR